MNLPVLCLLLLCIFSDTQQVVLDKSGPSRYYVVSSFMFGLLTALLKYVCQLNILRSLQHFFS